MSRRGTLRQVVVHGPGLTEADVVAVARQGARVVVGPEVRARLERNRRIVDRIAASRRAVYGVSTGFGGLANTRVIPGRRREMQHALLRSHAAGMGEPVEPEVVRAMALLRVRTLAMGVSGVRPAVVDALTALLNSGLVPAVPDYGSLGCSGDLAPLAHVGLALTGEGEFVDGDVRTAAGPALAAAGLAPLQLEAKEALALINGTDGTLGMLVLACRDLGLLLKVADVAAAASIEALLGTDRPFADRLQRLRPHPGQAASARNVRILLKGSVIVASHRHLDHAVQDSYSMRCSPQVNGAARDALDFARGVAAKEMGSAIDNPVVLDSGDVESNGNFHGAPLGMACDFLAIAAAQVSSIAERRIDRLLDPARSAGLPAFLATEPGINSGMMIAQYTAAGLVADNRLLAQPAGVDTIPTSAMQEDHVSMAWGAARKLRILLANLARVLAVELVCAARGLDLRAPLEPAPGTAAARAALREAVPGPGPDRPLAPELAAAEMMVRDGSLLDAVQRAVGKLR